MSWKCISLCVGTDANLVADLQSFVILWIVSAFLNVEVEIWTWMPTWKRLWFHELKGYILMWRYRYELGCRPTGICDPMSTQYIFHCGGRDLNLDVDLETIVVPWIESVRLDVKVKIRTKLSSCRCLWSLEPKVFFSVKE